MYYLDKEDMDCLINLKYKSVPCTACQGKGYIYVCENGDVHPSRSGFEDTWFYDSMETECDDCNGLKVKILLDSGLSI